MVSERVQTILQDNKNACAERNTKLWKGIKAEEIKGKTCQAEKP